jgi:alkylhydroperoxidase/carboxymuconolactone decarboxylase family protein YurZ
MRAILSLAITASQGQVPAVKAQVKTSYQAGWTKEEIGKVLLQVY